MRIIHYIGEYMSYKRLSEMKDNFRMSAESRLTRRRRVHLTTESKKDKCKCGNDKLIIRTMCVICSRKRFKLKMGLRSE